MICYRDKTFCSFLNCMHSNTCHRALTKEIRKMADKWWGKGKDKAPICQYSDKPECWEINN